MVRINILLIFLLLSCSVAEKNDGNKFSLRTFSKDYKYVLAFENSINAEDSVRVENFSIYKLNEAKRKQLLKARETSDSLFNNHGILMPDSLKVSLSLDEDGMPVRNFQVLYEESDQYHDSLFTKRSFSWNLEDSTLTYSSMGLTIKLE